MTTSRALGPSDAARVGELLRAVAAEEIMPRFRQLGDEEVWHKRPGNVVTIADTESERRLKSALTALVPGSATLGEEEAEHGDVVLGRLHDDAPLWIIDPLDGTSNFAAGKDRFAVIVAYAIDGIARAGWILDPVNDRLASAEEGGGAWLDGERARVTAAPSLAEMRGSLGGRLRRDAALCGRFAAVINAGSCGIEYIELAAAAIDFAHYRRLKPWDHAAGELIHREAGGFAACLDRRPYRPAAPGEGGLLLAADRDAWRAIAEVLEPVVAALPPPS
jgi:fructose-1,6-bisphosphatase/inositol monophosphatase family enzyme